MSVAADATTLRVKEEVTLTAVITNAPAGSGPTYQWQLDLGGGSWYSAGTEAAFSYLQNNAGSNAFRVTVTYGSGASTTSDPITITWVPPNRAPVADDQAKPYQGFTGTDNAPRGTLVSKVYDGIFSDPDGDELTYTVSVPADRSELVDSIYVGEDTQRVFIRLDAEDDWGAVTPALPKSLVTAVTLTATDPDGLSASVTGEFQTNWESGTTFLDVCDRTSQVRDALMELADKACEDIGTKDLVRVVSLDLSNTGLRFLKLQDFSGLPNMSELNMASNDFTSWTDACAANFGDSVQNIDLTYNYLGGTGAQIKSGCFTATKYPDLRSLHLAGNRINSLAGTPFSGLTNLEILDLSQNQITALPTGVFTGLTKLRYLDLGRNSIATGTTTGLPDNIFSALSSLEHLKLNNQFEQDSDNNYEPKTTALLTTLTASVFSGLSSLKELDLANNGITSTGLPNNVFQPLSSLESLALFGNAGSPFTLTNKGVRSEASVTQVVTPPTGFTVEPVSGGVKLTWDDPNDTNISHEYRALTPDGTGSIGWTDISSPTDNGTTLEKTVSTGVSSGKNYFFQLRSEKSGAHSWRANADCSVNFGTSGNDTLTGSPYPDCIVGLAGDDTLEGGNGADKLDGGAGTDTASYAGSVNGVEVDLSISTAQAAYGNSPSSGNVLSNIENITGSSGYDTLTGDANANVIAGGAGNDVIEGGAGGDTMTGGPGIDTLTYASAGSEGSIPGVEVNISSTPKFVGHYAAGDSASGFENLIGTNYSDILVGDVNDNVIEGLAGKDELNGGGGTDTLSYASSDDSVVVNFAGGHFDNKTSTSGQRVGGGGHAEGNIISNFENAIGSDYPDWFIINAAGTKIDGGLSIDDGKSTIYFPNADTWNHGRGDDGIHHMQEFYHSLGDVVDYRKSDAGVTVNLTTGTNTGGIAAGDTLTGIESIAGSPHADTLTGDGNDNTFFGGAGADTFDGKGGTDVVDYSWFHTTETVSPGKFILTLDLKTPSNNTYHADGDTFTNIEWIIGSQYRDKITGSDGNDKLSGGSGSDDIRGGDGDDTLWGRDPLILRGQPPFGDYYDDLRGGAGNDLIIIGADAAWGDAGNDKLLAMASGHMDGGDGTDEYYFHRNYFPGPAKNAGAAQVINYEDNEKIRICMGSGKGTADGQISWTTAVEEVAGEPGTDDIVVTVSLTYGTEALNQGTFLVADYTDTSNLDIAWSDPAPGDGTGCASFGGAPGQTRIIRSEVSNLIVPVT